MKRAPSPDRKGKRRVRPRIPPAGQRTPREQTAIERATLRVMGTRARTQLEIEGVQHRLNLNNDPMEVRAELMSRMDRLTQLRTKLDNDYVHWDDIEENGYDKNDPDDMNYPPPSPPPTGGAQFV